MDKKSKLYVLDPEGILFKQFSKIDIEKLNITFARKLDTLLKRANMTFRDALLVDSENTEQWENGKSLSDQLPGEMKVFATTVGGGQVFKVGNPIDIGLLYRKIDEDNSFVGQFLDEIPDRVKRQQSIDSILNIRDKNRYKNMDNIIATINKQEVDEVIMKDWNDPHKDLEIDLDGIMMTESDENSTLDVDDDGSKIIELSDIEMSDSDSDWEPPFELEIEVDEEEQVEEYDYEDDGTNEDFVENDDDFDIEEIDDVDEIEEIDDIDESDGTQTQEVDIIEVLNDEFIEEELNNTFESDVVELQEERNINQVIKSEPIPIPHKVIVKKNLNLKVGEKTIVKKGVDGWYDDNNRVDPIDEIVEVGPDIIKELPFEVEEKHVEYLPSGTKELVTKGELGIEADGLITKAPVKEVVLVGIGEINSKTDNNKPLIDTTDGEPDTGTKKRRRRRRRRKKRNTDVELIDDIKNNEINNQHNNKPNNESYKNNKSNNVMNVDSILSELGIYGDYSNSDIDSCELGKAVESKKTKESSEPNKQVNISKKPINNKKKDGELSILDSLLDDIDITGETDRLPEEDPTPSIDNILNKLRGDYN